MRGNRSIKGATRLALLAGASVALSTATATAADLAPMAAFSKGARILFQGDSITDGNRGRSADPNHILGHGYCFIIAAKYGSSYPDRQLDFVNRGVSANTVLNLADRWQKDTLDVKPDLLSVLCGVNDLGKNVPLDQYEQVFDKLLTDARAANPKLKIVLGEPFGLPTGAKKPGFDERRKELAKRSAIVEKLAKKHNAAFVRYQQAFDEACTRAPAEHWIWDGVHPTYNGHQIMADEWVKTVNAFWP